MRAPRDFLLNDGLKVEALCARPRFADHNAETFDAVLDTAKKSRDGYRARQTRWRVSPGLGTYVWSPRFSRRDDLRLCGRHKLASIDAAQSLFVAIKQVYAREMIDVPTWSGGKMRRVLA